MGSLSFGLYISLYAGYRAVLYIVSCVVSENPGLYCGRISGELDDVALVTVSKW